jgi:cell division protein FtsA
MDKSSTQEKSSPIVVGLDIGTTKICAIVGRRSKNGKIEVLGIGKAESAGVTRGMVSNIDKTVQGITLAVDIAGTQSNVEIRIVNVGIAGQHIKSLQHRGLITRKDLSSEIGRKDIDKLVEDMYNLVMPPGEEIIHVLPQEFTVDNEPGVKDPIGMAGVRLEANFHIISGQVTAIKNIVKCVNKAQLESQELILEPLASSESVLTRKKKPV